MKETVLQDWVIKSISKNPTLFGRLATYLNHTPRYFLNVLRDNPPHLTQEGVLEIIREELDTIKKSDLLTKRDKEVKTIGNNKKSAA